MKNPFKSECLIVKAGRSAAYSVYSIDGPYMGSIKQKRYKGSRWYANYKDSYQMKGRRSLQAALAQLIAAYQRDSCIVSVIDIPAFSFPVLRASINSPIEYIPKANDIIERTIKPEPPCALDDALKDLGIEDESIRTSR